MEGTLTFVQSPLGLVRKAETSSVSKSGPAARTASIKMAGSMPTNWEDYMKQRNAGRFDGGAVEQPKAAQNDMPVTYESYMAMRRSKQGNSPQDVAAAASVPPTRSAPPPAPVDDKPVTWEAYMAKRNSGQVAGGAVRSSTPAASPPPAAPRSAPASNPDKPVTWAEYQAARSRGKYQ